MSHPKRIFEDIYNQYIEKIFRFIFFRVNSQEKAEDISSEVFSRYWQQLKKGLKIENPSAFLYKVARNLVTDYYREKGRAQMVSLDNCPPEEINDPNSNIVQQAVLRSDFNTILSAMTNLKQDYQEIIIWRYLDELSIPEIAKMLNKSEGAIRVMLCRALKVLKNQLK